MSFKIVFCNDGNYIVPRTTCSKGYASYDIDEIPSKKTSGKYCFVYRIHTPPDKIVSSEEEYKSYIEEHKGEWSRTSYVDGIWTIKHIELETDVISPIFSTLKDARRWIKNQNFNPEEVGIGELTM